MADWPTTAKAERGWASRFSAAAAGLWRELQDELRDYGATIKAKDLEQRIRMIMGVTMDSDLPEKKLHFAAYPTRAKRPEMIRVPPSNNADVRGNDTQQDQQDDRAVSSDATSHQEPKREPLSDAALIDLYRQTQEDLAHRHMPYAVKASAQVDLEREMVRALDLDAFDRAGVEFMLDKLHLLTWPDPQGRPVRIMIEGQDMDPRE